MICKKCHKELPGFLSYICHILSCSKSPDRKPAEPPKAKSVLQKAKSPQAVKERSPDELAQSIGLTIPHLPEWNVTKRVVVPLPSYFTEKLILCERKRKLPQMSANISTLFSLKYGLNVWESRNENELAFELKNEFWPISNDGYLKLDPLFNFFQKHNLECSKVSQNQDILELTWKASDQAQKCLKITKIVSAALHLRGHIADITQLNGLEFCLNVKSYKLEDLAITVQATEKTDGRWLGHITVNDFQLPVAGRKVNNDGATRFGFADDFDCTDFAKRTLRGEFKELLFAYDSDDLAYSIECEFQDSFTDHTIKIVLDHELSKAYFEESLKEESAEY